MIKSIASLALMTLISAPAFASEWNIDVSHSEVGFKVRHMMVSNTSGQFKTFKGTISSKDKKNFLEGLKIAVDIDPASIDTQDKKRDDHLRAPDFFDVKKFPKMTFKSTKVTEVKGDGAKIAGLLTMHGVTQPVILKVEGFDTEIKGPGWLSAKKSKSPSKSSW